MSQNTLINGNRFSWTSIEIRIAGLSFPGLPFRAINYDATKKRPKVYGNGIKPVGRTRGQFDCTGSFEILASEWDQLAASLAAQVAANSQGFMDAEFLIQVSYEEINGSLGLGGVEDVRNDALIGCSVDRVSFDNSQGTEPTVAKVELSIMDISLNNLFPVGASSGTSLALGLAGGITGLVGRLF